jgi:FAD/FMN-containing dehydrogenase
MGQLSAEHSNRLATTFGDRMTTRRVERKLYSHDVGEMPLLIKPLIGTPMADAVVQPASKAEIVALVKWAAANHIPLVPRGKAMSGYGGVLPVKGGVVIDFFHMAKVLHVDVDGQTATLQPGNRRDGGRWCERRARAGPG